MSKCQGLRFLLVLRFIDYDGEVIKMGDRDLKVACMNERIGEDLMMES